MPGTTLRNPNNPSCSSAPDSERAFESEARDRVIEYLEKFRQPPSRGLASESARSFRGGVALSQVQPELTMIGSDYLPFNKLHLFKFRQECKGIPIYGSLVTVEIEIDEKSVHVDSSKVDIISFIDVGSSPSIKEEELKERLEQQIGYSLESLTLNPKLYYYYDRYYFDPKTKEEGKWHIVYITGVKLKDFQTLSAVKEPLQELVDYVVDAQTGELITKFPLVRTVR